MKKFLFSLLAIFATMAFAADKPQAGSGEVEVKGFLATEWCLKNDYFKDCRLDSTLSSPLALYVHSENKIYLLDASNSKGYELYENISKNNVTAIGKLDGNTIKIREFIAAPVEGKSFFKGCL